MADDMGGANGPASRDGGKGGEREGRPVRSQGVLDIGKTSGSEKEVRLEPVDVEGRRENVRGFLAGFLVAILGAVVLASIGLLANDRIDGDEVESIAQLFMTPLVAIVGTVVGFYFGGQTAREHGAGRDAERRRDR